MSLEANVQALAALFEELCSLNREALKALSDGSSLPILNDFFERKRRLTEVLAQEQEILSRTKTASDLAPSLTRALQSQREAAMLELQLAEALGNTVSSNGNVIEAYKKLIPGQASDGLDQSI